MQFYQVNVCNPELERIFEEKRPEMGAMISISISNNDVTACSTSASSKFGLYLKELANSYNTKSGTASSHSPVKNLPLISKALAVYSFSENHFTITEASRSLGHQSPSAGRVENIVLKTILFQPVVGR